MLILASTSARAQALNQSTPKFEALHYQNNINLNHTSGRAKILAAAFVRNTNKRYVEQDVLAKKEFIISVARGQVRKFKYYFRTELAAPRFVQGLDLNRTIAVNYSPKDEFKGPKFGNGTEYWVYFYQNVGYYDQEIYVNGAKVKTRAIKFTEPSKYRIYAKNY